MSSTVTRRRDELQRVGSVRGAGRVQRSRRWDGSVASRTETGASAAIASRQYTYSYTLTYIYFAVVKITYKRY